MAQFVCQHGLHFRRAQLVEQRVKKHHPFGRPKAGEISIGMGRALAAIHHEQTFGRKAAAFHQCLDAELDGFIAQGFEAVEEGCDEQGVHHHHQQAEAAPGHPCPEPPHGASLSHQPKYQRGQWQTQHGAHHEAFDRVGQNEPPGHAVEAELLLDAEGAVEVEWRFEEAAQERETRQQAELIDHGSPAWVDGFAQPSVQKIQAAEEGPREENRRPPQGGQHAQASFGNGVVGRFLVCSRADGVDKGRRNLVAPKGHTVDLTRGKPQLHQHREAQGAGKQKSECERGHEKRGERECRLLLFTTSPHLCSLYDHNFHHLGQK